MTISKNPFLFLWFTVTTLDMAVAKYLTKGRKYKTYLRHYFFAFIQHKNSGLVV